MPNGSGNIAANIKKIPKNLNLTSIDFQFFKIIVPAIPKVGKKRTRNTKYLAFIPNLFYFGRIRFLKNGEISKSTPVCIIIPGR